MLSLTLSSLSFPFTDTRAFCFSFKITLYSYLLFLTVHSSNIAIIRIKFIIITLQGGLHTIGPFSFPGLILPGSESLRCSFFGPNLYPMILGKTIILCAINKGLLPISMCWVPGYSLELVHRKDTVLSSWSSQSTSTFQISTIPSSLWTFQPTNTIPGTCHIPCVLTAFFSKCSLTET